jgi:molybdopterin molybdotransferase
VRIFTGGVVPQGLDAILIQEDAEAGDGWVAAREAPQAGRYIRQRGLDFAEGEEVLPAGRRLTARDVGLAASANHPWLTVHRRPRIGLLATGDEIALPGEAIPVGGIVSSNTHALAALVRAAGGEPVALPVAPDDREAIAAAGRAARGCDLLVTTGGASVGDHDLVQSALGEEGFTLDFWKIAMRPGKPLIWGRLGDVPVLGLPGNPVSTLVCGVQFLAPAVSVLSGLPAAPPRLIRVRVGAPLGANDRRFDHLRATLSEDRDGRVVAHPFPVQDSAMLKTLARADALILRPPFAPALPEGAEAEVIPLGTWVSDLRPVGFGAVAVNGRPGIFACCGWKAFDLREGTYLEHAGRVARLFATIQRRAGGWRHCRQRRGACSRGSSTSCSCSSIGTCARPASRLPSRR